MRLLQIQQDGEFTLVELFGNHVPPYAILSHTWGSQDDEVSFQNLQDGSGETKRGYRKLLFCSKEAAKDQLRYFWVDTCCIDKTSSAELSEAINSMYMWYQAAHTCYAYLEDVSSIDALPNSRWFTRGWTLQELIAPANVVFFNHEWELLGTKLQLSDFIRKFTGIPTEVLLEDKNLESFSIAQKMSWAAHRQTTRVEDRAYCLLGIFEINMPLIYGEGENAFIRLQEEIMKISDDHSLLAWQSSDGRGGCLAVSPNSFRDCANVVQTNHLDTFYDPPLVSSRGVQIEVRFLGCGPGRRGLAILNCCEEGSEDKPFAFYVQDLSLSMKRFERIHADGLTQIFLRAVDPSQYSVKKLHIRSGRPSGKNLRLKTHHAFPAENMDWQTGSTLSHSMETSETYFDALRFATEDDVWLLLTRPKIRVNMQNELGQTALHYAVTEGSESVVRVLLGQTDIDVNLVDYQGRTPLSYAAGAGRSATVVLLLDDIRVERNTKDLSGRTPLSWAASNGHDSVIVLLLHTGNAHIDVKDKDGWTPLSWAIKAGHRSTAKLLMEMKSAHASAQHDDEILSIAQIPVDANEIMQGKDMLLTTTCAEQGVIAFERQWDEWELFYDALDWGRVDTIRLLLDLGMDIDARDKDGLTMLVRAAAHDSDDGIALFLIEHGADVNAAATNGRTPLHEAALGGHLRIAKALLNKGADIEAKNDKTWTPLHEAAEHGKADVAYLLLENGANFTTKDRYGWTALIGAVNSGHVALVRKLIDSGADVNVAMDNGWSPMSSAVAYDNVYLKQLLNENGDIYR